MKTVLFENVGGNQFKLLKESVTKNESLVASGVKKVFMNSDKAPIPYKRIEAVGLGYIKDITEAKRISLDEARILAKEFGYKDSENDAQFVKDSPNPLPLKQENDETDMNNPEEKREVQIGKEIINRTQHLVNIIPEDDWAKYVTPIQELAKELIKMHGQQ